MRIRFAFVLPIALFGIAVHVSGQSEDSRAILEVGPIRNRGLIFLPINVIDHYVGEYVFGETRITVYYTDASIVPFDDWTRYQCEGRELRVVESVDDSLLLYLVHDEEWHVFFEGPASHGRFCAFTDSFVQRLRYFKEVSDPGGVPPFPAILDLL